MTTSLDRARADLDAGRAWKARDRLQGLVRDRQDPEVLDLLATVHHEMRDLPAAGALWFVTGRDDAVAREALSAWRERHGNDEARWHSIPSPVRRGVRSQGLSDLQGAAEQRVANRRVRRHEGDRARSRADRFVTVVLDLAGLLILATFLIGMWTVLRWIWS